MSEVDPSSSSSTTPSADIVPLGSAPELPCSVVAANLSALVRLPAQVLAALPEPRFAYVPGRGQYDASLLMDHLSRQRPPRRLRLGVAEVDLCLPIFSHVYGESLVGGGVAVVSLYRLGGGDAQAPCPPSRIYERLAKVSCHEAGHALGLTHCPQPNCVMCFAGTLQGLDELHLAFCPACEEQLALGRALLVRADRPC